jgi:NADH-quinone oxidoreductase subunit A
VSADVFEVQLTSALWYVLGFAFAGFTFVFMTIGMSWLISHRHKGDRHKGLPYESGIDTFGDTWGRFGLSFYIYALLFVAACWLVIGVLHVSGLRLRA